MITTRFARVDDVPRLGRMRRELWPDEGSAGEHERELEEILAGKRSSIYPYAVLVAEIDGDLAGFAEVTLRSYADGCEAGRPVGYLEGWFVEERHRRKGAGAALVHAAEDWARGQGCTEFASDTWLDNEASQKAHQALGFDEVDRVVNYRKPL
jgi:aminoglycoside 6'-N-acetyltransferase I